MRHLFMNIGDLENPDVDGRSWDDCRRFGFMAQGGGLKWITQIRSIRPGDHIFAYANGSGYVGHGIALGLASSRTRFVPPGQRVVVDMLQLNKHPTPDRLKDPDLCDWCVPVSWLATLARGGGVCKSWYHRGALGEIRRPRALAALFDAFGYRKTEPRSLLLPPTTEALPPSLP